MSLQGESVTEAEVVYSPDMPKTTEQLAQELGRLEKVLEKVGDKHDKLGERVTGIIENRIVPSEHRINQVHGLGKWAAGITITLLLTVGIVGGKNYFSLEDLRTRSSEQRTILEGLRDSVAKLLARSAVSSPNAPQEVQQALTTPVSRESPADSIRAIAAVADEAGSRKIDIPDQAFETAGNNLLLAARTFNGPDAWDAFLKLVRYRCVTNEKDAPNGNLAVSIRSSEFPNWKIADEHEATFVKMLGKVPVEQSAQFHLIGENPNADRSFGPEWIFIYHHEHLSNLDGFVFKNVVFMNADLYYAGGPVRLQNVYFVNCNFKVKQSYPTERLLLAVLKNTPTTFTP